MRWLASTLRKRSTQERRVTSSCYRKFVWNCSLTQHLQMLFAAYRGKVLPESLQLNTSTRPTSKRTSDTWPSCTRPERFDTRCAPNRIQWLTSFPPKDLVIMVTLIGALTT